MPKTLVKSQFFPDKNKIKNKPELNNSKSNLPPNFQKLKQKLLSGNELFIYE